MGGKKPAVADEGQQAAAFITRLRLRPFGELTCPLVDSIRPTHASPQCLLGCAYLGLVLCGLIHGLDRGEVLAPDWGPLRQLKELHALHAEVAAGSFRDKEPSEIVGSGYVVKTLEAAL